MRVFAIYSDMTSTTRTCAAKRYMSGWFVCDIIGALPWSLAEARALKLLKLFRVAVLRKPITRETGKAVNLSRVGRILLYFLIISHWVGCMWWAIGALETQYAYESGIPVDVYRSSWLQRIPLTKWNSQLAYSLSKESTFVMQYFSSLYWSVTALVKVPWIAPNTVVEKVYASAVVMIGAIFFASLLGSIVAAIAAIDRSNAQRRDKMTLMHNFCMSRRLSSGLKSGMTRYVDAMFAFNNDVEGTERLGALPAHLRSSLLEVIYGRMLANCELFLITSRQTALLLCQHIQPQVCLAKSILVERNSIATHLFLLHRGALHVTLGEVRAATVMLHFLRVPSPSATRHGLIGVLHASRIRRDTGPRLAVCTGCAT